MIEVRQLNKRFGNVVAVTDLSFDASDGAVTGLLGANGAGKTTTLKMLAGVLKPDSGRIRTSIGVDGAASESLGTDMGALLDHRGLYERLTARENLRYFARLRGMDPIEADERVAAVIADLGIQGLADRRTAGFSEGERMKVALGRAIVHRPRNLLLDEPTNGLDVPTVRLLRQMLVSLAEGGTCVLFSSHVLAEVENLCDRIVVLAGGTVVGCGTSRELTDATGTTSLEEAFLRLTTNHCGEERCAA